MAIALTNAQIWFADTDLTGFSNKVDVGVSVEDVDTTVFGVTWKSRIAGLRDSAVAVEGFYEAADLSKPDDQLMTRLGSAVTPVTLIPAPVAGGGAAVGDLAYLTRALETDYKVYGEVGQAAPFAATAGGDWPLVRGEVINAKAPARTVTGAGTPRQVGAVLASQRLYAMLHVFSIAGTDTPTLTVALESDNDVGFATGITRGTFAAVTAVGAGQALRIAGPVTDDWWRASFVISGTNPSFVFGLAVGVGPL